MLRLIDARFQQALTTTNQFLDALAAGQLRQGAGGQCAAGRGAAQGVGGQAPGRLGDPLGLAALAGDPGERQPRSDHHPAPTLAAAEANLARLIGQTGRVKAADDSAFYRVVPALDTVASAPRPNPSLPGFRAPWPRPQPPGPGCRAARSAYWPTLTLGAEHRLERHRANDYDLLNQRQLSLWLRWNLFDRFDRELTIAQREADRDVAEATRGRRPPRVAAELTAALAELDAARLQIEITQTSVVAASEDLRVQQERYRLGAVDHRGCAHVAGSAQPGGGRRGQSPASTISAPRRRSRR